MYGEWIKEARNAAGLTLKEASERAGLSYDGLSRIERNINGATMGTLERLAGVYGVLVGDLLPNKGAMVGQRVLASDLEPISAALDGFTPHQRRAVVTAMLAQAQMVRALLSAPAPEPLAEGHPRSYPLDQAALTNGIRAFAPDATSEGSISKKEDNGEQMPRKS